MPNVKYAKVLDTRLEAVSSNDICYVVEQGANVVNYTPLVSSSHSNQNTTFNLNNIADVTCRQSRIVMGATVTLTLSMTNSSNVALDVVNADNFGFKQFPLNRCMTSIQHQINQASYTLNSYDILDAITKLNYNSPDMNFFENTQPDSVDSYANATGTLINPIASYASSIQGEGIFKPRSLNYTISEIPSGCCGMAGSFGYEKEHFELSQKIGNQVLFPAIEKVNNKAIIVANGTSCRHQIFDGVNKTSKHAIEVLYDALL